MVGSIPRRRVIRRGSKEHLVNTALRHLHQKDLAKLQAAVYSHPVQKRSHKKLSTQKRVEYNAKRAVARAIKRGHHPGAVIRRSKSKSKK